MILGQPMSVIREHSLVELQVLAEAAEAAHAADILRMGKAIALAFNDSPQGKAERRHLIEAAQ